MNASPLKVAYLVVCWNNREIIDECLQSLQAQTYKNNAIYVIDNASADDTAQYVADNYPDVILITSDANNGFAKGNNMLIQEALKDSDVGYMALINSDAVLDKDWTTEIMSYLSTKTNVAAAQGITLDYYDHGTIDAEHIYVGTNFQSVQYGYGNRFKQAYAHPRKVFGVNAAAAMYSREFIEEQPGNVLFDERFYMYLEDVDVSFRAIVTGWSNYYIPSARAYHMGSVSSKKRSSGYNIQMTIRNQAALLFKNMPAKTFFAFLPEAIKFERHFYRYLKQVHGKEVAKKARMSRLKGICRLPIYVADRYRLRRRTKINHTDLERIMRAKGIL